MMQLSASCPDLSSHLTHISTRAEKAPASERSTTLVTKDRPQLRQAGMSGTLPQPRDSTPTLGQQHHPRHDDECEGQEFDDGERRLQPGTPGDAPGIEGEDNVWRGDHTGTAIAHARRTWEKIQQCSLL